MGTWRDSCIIYHRTAFLLLGRALVSELVGYGQFSKATKRMRKKECSNGAEL